MKTSRRRFLVNSTAAFAAPFILPSTRAFAADDPGRTIRLGHIGVGGQGNGLLRNFLSVKGATSVAIADPVRAKRESAGKRVKEVQGHEPKLYNDFRQLLADPAIDAVVIATPDHWHVPIGIEAVQAGKDVYIEKPLGYTLAQNKAMMDACVKHDRVFQYGTQQRSQEILQKGIEAVINGAIGAIERIEVWAPGGKGGGSLEEIPVPDGMDYNLYIGPAPMKPCTKDRITSPGSWYCRDYALGFIAGWGAHPLDISIWGLDHDQQGPFKIRGTGKAETPNALFNAITSWNVNVEFAGGIPMHFMSDDIAKPLVDAYRKNWCADGTTFYGSKGWISLSRGGVAASDMNLFRREPGPDDKRVAYKNNYYRGFVESVREHKPSVAPIGDAVRSDALSHLSVLAIESGSEIVWDPKAYRIVSPEALNEKMSAHSREEWLKG